MTVLLEALDTLLNEGFKITTLVTLILLYRKHLKSKQMNIKIDAIAKAVGVCPVEKKSYIPSMARITLTRYFPMRSHAIIAAAYTHRREIYPLKKLLSRKFLLAISTALLVALNDALNWGLDQGTITSVCSVVVGWIVAEAGTDIVKIKNGNGDFDGTKSH